MLNDRLPDMQITKFPLRALLQSSAAEGQVAAWDNTIARWVPAQSLTGGIVKLPRLEVLRTSATSGPSRALSAVYTYGTATSDSLVGLHGEVITQHATGTTVTVVAMSGTSKHEGAGNVTNLRGCLATAWQAGAGAVENLIGLSPNLVKSGAGTITNAIGIRIPNINVGSNNFSIESLGGTMYHVGNVGVGINSPAAAVHILKTTEQLRLAYDASNYLSVTVGSGGLATLSQSGDGIKLGSSASHKVGFWGVSPVAQQVLATGAGASVDNVITMLQLIGLCKQS